MDTKRQDRFVRSETPPTPPSPPSFSSSSSVSHVDHHAKKRFGRAISDRSVSPISVVSGNVTNLATTFEQQHRNINNSRNNRNDGTLQDKRRRRRGSNDSRSSPISSNNTRGGHRRSRSNERDRENTDRENIGRSGGGSLVRTTHKYGRRDRSRSRSRQRSRSRERRRSRSRNKSRDRHGRYRGENSRRQNRGTSHTSDNNTDDTSDIILQQQLIQQQQLQLQQHHQQQQLLQLQQQRAIAASRSNAFKNDGSFMEMFKKMQEQMKPEEKSTGIALEEKPVVPPPLMVGKRRGGRILKTGMVAKAKTEQTVDQPKDAWSLYMAEVKKYREVCCQEEDNTRPLVK